MLKTSNLKHGTSLASVNRKLKYKNDITSTIEIKDDLFRKLSDRRGKWINLTYSIKNVLL